MILHFPFWRYAILLLAMAPLGYYIVGSLAAIRFFRRERSRRLPDFTPPVSLLKPVRGVDFASYENFKSFCLQDYPSFEILFCVNDLSDPAVPLIQQLIGEFPERDIKLFSGAEQIGSNRKVNNLVLLTQHANHEILVQSDGDVRVRPQFLREVVAPFLNSQVGAVSCFYRGVAEDNLGAKLEAVGASSDFFAGALVADWKEGVTFALGASVATTKTWLGRMGGYQVLASLLADDYELGNRIHKAEGKVLLSREPVWTMYSAQTARGFWQHQLRWARTVRLCRPVAFLGLLFTHGLPWSLLAAAISPNLAIATIFLLSYLVLRLSMAWIVGVWGIGDQVLRTNLWLVPLRDAAYFAVWVASLTSNKVTWGDSEFLLKDGRMLEVRQPPNS